MKNLLLHLTEWRKRLEQEPLALFLDYDGTLVDIAPTPGAAGLPKVTRQILKALVKLKDVKVAIISGRGLRDLRAMVPVRGLTYVGSHGLEFKVNGKAFSRVSARYLKVLRVLRSRLRDDLRDRAGILLENKAYSLAIHFRNASPVTEKMSRQAIQDVCLDVLHAGQIALLPGKKLIEIMPPIAVDKGQAVERLLRLWGRRKFVPIFIGDDRTDEAAFAVLREKGLTVRIGRSSKHSKAEYSIDRVDDVRRFLSWILFFRAE
jgi:trehalose 6-phosphate phosphatase